MGEPDWVAEARRLAAVFAERAASHDREGSFPFENFADLREAGFLRMTVPRAFGGFEAPIGTFLAVQEELARGDASTALALMMHTRFFGQARDGTVESPRWWEAFCRGAVAHGWTVNTVATEEGLGSPAGGGLPDTVATRADGGWLLEGRKTFTTMAPLLHFFLVLARIDEPGREPALANFVVYRDDPGVHIEETWDSLGMRSTGSHDVVLDRVRLPADRFMSMRLARGEPRSAPAMAWFGLGVAATTLGVARAARDYAVAFARERTPNSQRTIREYPGVRMRIARIDLLLHRSAVLIADAAGAYAARDTAPPGGLPVIGRIATAKIDTVNNCIEAVDLAMRVVGGVSLQKRRPIERYYRDVRSGLHNPPIEDRALEILAGAALDAP